ncbi:hypothetical protein, partial [Moorena sp. SIO3H5]|uniref:hypothetical protein n=1 Tax=Moorena sp. SIO3H5 TaxID=2607834 RepID=UPI0025F19BD0
YNHNKLQIMRGYLIFLILNFAPLAPLASNPSLGGNKNPFAGKSPPILGDLGGLDVANETSQITSEGARNLVQKFCISDMLPEEKKSCLPYTPHLSTLATFTFFFTTMISTLLVFFFFPNPTPNQ